MESQSWKEPLGKSEGGDLPWDEETPNVGFQFPKTGTSDGEAYLKALEDLPAFYFCYTN